MSRAPVVPSEQQLKRVEDTRFYTGVPSEQEHKTRAWDKKRFVYTLIRPD